MDITGCIIEFQVGDVKLNILNNEYFSPATRGLEKAHLIAFVLELNLLSAYLYKHTLDLQEFVLQIHKTQKLALQFLSRESLEKLSGFLCHDLFFEIVRATSLKSNITDHYQILRLKAALEIHDFNQALDDARVVYLSSSINADIKEAVMILFELLVKCKSPKVHDYKNLISPYITVSSHFVRLRELNLQAKLCESAFFQKFAVLREFWILKENWNTYLKFRDVTTMEIDSLLDKLKPIVKELLEEACKIDAEKTDSILSSEVLISPAELIGKSIFCIDQIITIYKGYSFSFLNNYYSLGEHHRRLSDWIKYFELVKLIYQKLKDNKEFQYKCFDQMFNVEGYLSKILNNDLITSLNVTAESMKAYQCYISAIDMHSGGQTYSDQIRHMYYLDDEFDDSLYHFSYSLERYRINSNIVNERIKDVTRVFKESQFFDSKAYLNHD